MPSRIDSDGGRHPASWREWADSVLRELWQECAKQGRAPSKQEIYDAYPFGMREYTPYKVWLEEVRWFKDGCPAVSARHPGHAIGSPAVYVPPKEQGVLL